MFMDFIVLPADSDATWLDPLLEGRLFAALCQVSVSPDLITHNVRVIHSCLMNNSNRTELVQYLFVFNSIACTECVTFQLPAG